MQTNKKTFNYSRKNLGFGDGRILKKNLDFGFGYRNNTMGGPIACHWSLFCSPQPDTSLCCKTMDMALVHGVTVYAPAFAGNRLYCFVTGAMIYAA